MKNVENSANGVHTIEGKMSENITLFRRPVILDKTRHRDLVINRSKGYTFAKEILSVPLSIVELSVAARHYPIVFSAEKNPHPLVVLGVRSKENLFIDSEGSWEDGLYIPAHIRRYPFVFLEVPDTENMVLCVDEEAEHFQEESGDALFDGDDTSPLVKEVLDMLLAFQSGYRQAREFTQSLNEKGLLASRRTDITLPSGKQAALDGFLMIDEEKFNALPDDVLLDWHKRGWLQLAYFHYQSMSNWGKLVDIVTKRDLSENSSDE